MNTIRYSSITKPEDFATTRRNGLVFKNQFVVIFINRNKVKRRLRSISSLIDIVAGVDILIVARLKAPIATYRELSDSILNLMKKASILENI